MSAKKKRHGISKKKKTSPRKRTAKSRNSEVARKGTKQASKRRKRPISDSRNVNGRKSAPKVKHKRKISEADYYSQIYEKELLAVCKQLKEPCTVQAGGDMWENGRNTQANAMLWVRGTDIVSVLDALARIQRLPKRYRPWIQVAFTGPWRDETYMKDGHKTFQSYATKNFALMRAIIIEGQIFENTKKFVNIEYIRVRLSWNEDDEQPDELI